MNSRLGRLCIQPDGLDLGIIAIKLHGTHLVITAMAEGPVTLPVRAGAEIRSPEGGLVATVTWEIDNEHVVGDKQFLTIDMPVVVG